MNYFSPDQWTLDQLGRMDPVMEKLIGEGGPINIPLQEDYFASIASAIVGQQLSNRVAEVLWQRLLDLTGNQVVPEVLLAHDDETLRQMGLSYSKIKYLKALSAAVDEGMLDLPGLDGLEDEEIVRQLTRVKGIGPWTAEMFLIFSMGRPDVFALGDGGLQRAVKWLYRLEQVPDKEILAAISSRWKPYRTTASLYLWRALDDIPKG